MISPPRIPPSTARMPATIPATTPTSSRPETCLAAIAQITIGIEFTSVSNTSDRLPHPGILLHARQSAMAINAGRLVIIIPRKLMRFHIFPSAFDAAFSPVLPMTGIYLIFQYFASAVVNATALVRFVVPVVPDADRTLHPMFCVSATPLPPVPAIGIFVLAQASIACLLAPSGLALTNITPSISPSSIFFASFASTFSASTLTSVKVP